MSIIHSDKISVMQGVISIRDLLVRLSLFLLILLSIAILVVGRVNTKYTEQIRIIITDISTPLLSVLSSPVETYQSVKDSLYKTIYVYQENERLIVENKSLLRLKAVAIELEAENRRLRNILNFIPEGDVSYITSRIVGTTGGPYNKSVIINSGTEKGIDKGYIVRNNQGLVGRIVEVGRNSARILLVTDINSRIPIITENTREKAIMIGDNTAMPQLIHLPKDTNISVGEKLVTSGDGKAFPSGVEVGIVQAVTDNSVLIKTSVDWNRLEYISVIDYKNPIVEDMNTHDTVE